MHETDDLRRFADVSTRWVLVASFLVLTGTSGCVQSGDTEESREEQTRDADAVSPADGAAIDAGDTSEATGRLQVEVRALDGRPIEGASISAQENTNTANQQGRATVEGLETGRTVVRAEADGFVPSTSIVQIAADATTRTVVELNEEGEVATISAEDGGEVTHEGTTVSVPANALVDGDGNPVGGDVEMSLTPADIEGTGGAALPGPTDAVRSSSGSAPEMIEALALADISFRKDGEPLQIKDGASVRVEYALPEDLASDYSEGEAIDAYWYDTSAGEWVREGSGEVKPTEDGGLKWVAELPHLTYWGACRDVDTYDCIHLEVLDSRGQPVLGAETAAIGAMKGAKAEGRTGSDGRACAQFIEETEVRMVVYPPERYGVFRVERTFEGNGVNGACFNGPDGCRGETIQLESRPGRPDAGRTDAGDGRPDGGERPDTTTGPDTGPSASGPVDISAGDDHTCVVLQSGSIRCWGANDAGQLGNGSTADEVTDPVEVQGISSAVEVTAGSSHTCARLEDGTARCWGEGALGTDSAGDEPVTSPVKAEGLSSIVDLSAHGNTCAVLQNGETRCWGGSGFWEKLGPDQDSSSTPVDVPTLPKAADVSVGRGHACAVLETGDVHCWGSNEFGQLGSGEQRRRGKPSSTSKVKGISSAVEVSAGRWNTCARLEDGELRCWGQRGPWLGDGSSTGEHDDFKTAVRVSGISSATSIAADSYGHACATLRDGSVRCWGGTTGSLGTRGTPGTISNLPAARRVTTGQSHTCVVLRNGDVRCWGSNNSGQLGDDSLDESDTPVKVEI